MDSLLFSDIRINKLTLPNRIVRSATHDYMALDDGSVSDRNIELYDQFKNIGLIISGFIYVSENGKCTSSQFGLYKDPLIPSFQKLTDTVHKNNQYIFAQLVHGGRQVRPKYIKGEIWAPSEIVSSDSRIIPKEMTEQDINSIIEDFVIAGVRAKGSGFDGIQLHAAHGYLLSQFLSPHTNKRDDQWGGSIENRTRIICKIINRMRKHLGNDYPICLKINGDDGGLENEISILDLKKAVKILQDNGADAIEVSRGMMGSPKDTVQTDITEKKDEAYLLDLAEAVKDEVNIPVISVGGYRHLSIMEEALKQDKCDMIAVSRGFIREPDLVDRLKNGQNRAKCISCNKCFNLRGIKCVYGDGE